MIALLDTNNLDGAEAELEMNCEQLLTPLTRYRPVRPQDHFAIDNGAYSGLDVEGFKSLLDREWPRRDLCRFVAVPDVVGSARRTLEVFELWRFRMLGWPLALVVQDGQEDLPIPWKGISAIFIGGSTAWKMSDHVAHITRAAQALGKWVHAGRVNTPERLRHFEELGVDSFDGSGLARYSHMRTKVRDRHESPSPLFEENHAA